MVAPSLARGAVQKAESVRIKKQNPPPRGSVDPMFTPRGLLFAQTIL